MMERKVVKFAWKPTYLDESDDSIIFKRYVQVQEQLHPSLDVWHTVVNEEYKPPRFQECGKIEQIWRYRWYLGIPFEAVYNYVRGVKDFKLHWKLAVGLAQSRMKWYYTSEEVDDIIRPIFKKIDDAIQNNKK